jgi:inner membrane protease subunit 1
MSSCVSTVRTLFLSRSCRLSNRSLQTIRRLMDAHKRPSHSGMFPVEPPPHFQSPAAVSEGSSSSTSSSASHIYRVMISRAAMAMGIVYVVTEYVADITLCEGPSMMPTIQPTGEIILIDKRSLWMNGFHDGGTAEERIRAAETRQQIHDPPDIWHQPHISVSDQCQPLTLREMWRHMRSPLSVGDVVVSNHPSRPGTVCKRITGLPGDQILQPNGSIETVPDGHIWLEGDNPNNSSDSRSYGALPMALLQGRVLLRVWPIRGNAWMRRGARPRWCNVLDSGSTVLPAGYKGEHIVKHVNE